MSAVSAASKSPCSNNTWTIGTTKQYQPNRRGNRDEENNARREVQGSLHLVHLTGVGLTGHQGQDRRRDGDRVSTQDQFHHAIGNIERHDRALDHMRCEFASNDDVDLKNADAEQNRPPST